MCSSCEWDISGRSQTCAMCCRHDEPTAEEGAYARANSYQSGDSMRSTRSTEDGEHSITDGEASSALNTDKRQRFADRRKDHYNMRTALQK